MKRNMMFLVMFFCFLSCENTPTKNTDVVALKDLTPSNQAMEDIEKESIGLDESLNTIPKETTAIKVIKKQQIINSQFLNLGCCQEAQKRLDDCCCEKVIADYEKNFLDENLEKLKGLSEDVIFNDCKKNDKWRKRIEKIESEDEGGLI